MKRLLCIILTAVMLFAAAGSAPAEEEGTVMTRKEFRFVFNDQGEPTTSDILALYFPEEAEDVPFIDIYSLPTLLREVMGSHVTLADAYEDGVLTLTRTDMDPGYLCEIDFNTGTIFFGDYDAFFMLPYQSTILDIAGLPVAPYIMRSAENSFQRFGAIMTIKASEEYGIPFFVSEDDAYMPFQTFIDLFLNKYSMSVLFNGSYIFWEPQFRYRDGSTTPAYELYVESATTAPRSEMLIDLNYKELCLALDYLYGLKEEHRITLFNNLFNETGLSDKLYSDDPTDASIALQSLIYGYLADSHSSLVMPSFRADRDVVRKYADVNTSFSGYWLDKEFDKFKGARAKSFDGTCPMYQEVGDTAYITFDSFVSTDRNYYEDPVDFSDIRDTFAMVIAIDSLIKREGSPIRNVVLDLSCNGGGASDAAVYVIGWFLGPSVLHTRSDMTGAQVSSLYRADVNLDGYYDDSDTLLDYNRYCLISPASFSCGNLVPAMFKFDSDVTLLGKTSGGGGCYVLPLTTLNGDLLHISAPVGLMTLKNGSFYQVDKGVDPDFWIDRIESYYDRETLTERIHNLDR